MKICHITITCRQKVIAQTDECRVITRSCKFKKNYWRNKVPSASVAKTDFLQKTEFFLLLNFDWFFCSLYEKCVFTGNRIKEDFACLFLIPQRYFSSRSMKFKDAVILNCKRCHLLRFCNVDVRSMNESWTPVKWYCQGKKESLGDECPSAAWSVINMVKCLYLKARGMTWLSDCECVKQFSTRWFKYDRDWFVCKQAALRSSCATLREWSHNLHPPSCSG